MENKDLLQEYHNNYNQYIKLADLLNTDFRFYIDIHQQIWKNISTGNLRNSEAFLQELQKIIFQEKICEETKLERKKNNFLKISFEVETLKNSPYRTYLADDIILLCKKIVKLIQKHWEFYQYKKEKLVLEDILSLFFQETEEIFHLWDSFIDKLEVLSRVLLIEQVSLEEKGTQKVNIAFIENPNFKNNFDSIENFIQLIQQTYQLIQLVKGDGEEQLRFISTQNQQGKIQAIFLLPLTYTAIFQNLFFHFHSEKLQKDGLQKMLLQNFSPSAVRNVEKKLYLNFKNK